MSHLDHRRVSISSTRCFVLTISDTRTESSDRSGQAVVELLSAAGHDVLGKTIVPDDSDIVRASVETRLSDPSLQVIITTGGTGISSRDQTYDVIVRLLDKQIDGFGELFRSLSYQDIGPAAMLSRACAGVAQGKILIAVPGSENAVRLAMAKLIIPELGHLVHEVSK